MWSHALLELVKLSSGGMQNLLCPLEDFEYYPKTTSTDFVTHMVNENYMQTAQLRQETS